MNNDTKISACIDKILFDLKGQKKPNQNQIKSIAVDYDLKENDMMELYKKLSDIGIDVVMDESKISILLKKYS